jgi:predicted thioredoxin/glutaredoxin
MSNIITLQATPDDAGTLLSVHVRTAYHGKVTVYCDPVTASVLESINAGRRAERRWSGDTDMEQVLAPVVLTTGHARDVFAKDIRPVVAQQLSECEGRLRASSVSTRKDHDRVWSAVLVLFLLKGGK